ncbi:MAG TPA: ferredoxin [Acidimicrobiales bacterium]
MRIVVDPGACTGHGRCYTLAPQVYEPDDDGYCATRTLEVPPGLEEQARTGARNCPERAIRVEGA